MDLPVKEYIALLEEIVITAETVDINSRRGGNTVGYGSSWKVYYRLAADPQQKIKEILSRIYGMLMFVGANLT